MARKRPSECTPQAIAAVPGPAPEPDVIPEGDYAGMTYDEVLLALEDGINKVLDEAEFPAVCAAVDKQVANVLMIAKAAMGPVQARNVAFRYAETIVPYLELEIETAEPTFRHLRKMAKELIDD